MSEFSDKELLEELGVAVETRTAAARTPRDERIVAGFEEILKFVEEHGRAPQRGEGNGGGKQPAGKQTAAIYAR